MATDNIFNGVSNSSGPKTPETDKLGNENVAKNDDPKSSGDSAPQTGEDVVNEQEQNDIVNAQGGDAAEEYTNSANNRTKISNSAPLAGS